MLFLIGLSISFLSLFLKTLLVGGSEWEIIAQNVQEEVETRIGNRENTEGYEKVETKREYGITMTSLGPEKGTRKIRSFISGTPDLN